LKNGTPSYSKYTRVSAPNLIRLLPHHLGGESPTALQMHIDRKQNHGLQYRIAISAGVIVLDREFFLGFIKIHILYHASKEPIFGVEIAEELARHGYRLSPGTLYPTLHRLEKEGYLKSSSKVVEGKVRKYYQATAEGKRVLEQSKGKIRELVTEVIEEK